MKYYYSKSKRLTWVLIAIATILTAFSLYLRLEGAAVAIWSTTIPSAVALYANKQYQDRKKLEIDGHNSA